MENASRIEVQVRNRLVQLPGVRLRRLRANVWEVTIPRSAEVARCLHVRSVELSSFDDLVFYLDGEPCLQAVGSAEQPEVVVVTVVQ